MAKFEYHLRSTHINPGVTMTSLSPAAQSDIVRFMCDNYLDSPDYRLKKESNPFLQGHVAESGWIFVEFWSDPEKHQTSVDRLLEIFRRHHPEGQVVREEVDRAARFAPPHTFPETGSATLEKYGEDAVFSQTFAAETVASLADIASSRTPLQSGEVNQYDFVEERVYFPMKQSEDSAVEKTIEIAITGPAGVGKSRITAMIHEMLEREFQNLKIEVNDHDGPKTYAMIKERLEEMKRYPLHPDVAVKISNFIQPQSLTDAIRESTEIATLNLPEPTRSADPYLAGIMARHHNHGLAANDDQENPE